MFITLIYATKSMMMNYERFLFLIVKEFCSNKNKNLSEFKRFDNGLRRDLTADNLQK